MNSHAVAEAEPEVEGSESESRNLTASRAASSGAVNVRVVRRASQAPDP